MIKNNGSKSEKSKLSVDEGGRVEPNSDQPRRPFRIPEHRTFVVRKFNVDHTALIDIVVKAHYVQCADTHIQFFDFEVDPVIGPSARMHRMIMHVEDIEDVDRVEPITSSRIITH